MSKPIKQISAALGAASIVTIGAVAFGIFAERVSAQQPATAVRDRLVEVEGRDASNREVELTVDRRSGEILSREFDE